MGPSSVLKVSVYNNDSSSLLLEQTLNGADQWTNGSQYMLSYDQYKTFELHNNVIRQVFLNYIYMKNAGTSICPNPNMNFAE
jgi:hypothetical protein